MAPFAAPTRSSQIHSQTSSTIFENVNIPKQPPRVKWKIIEHLGFASKFAKCLQADQKLITGEAVANDSIVSELDPHTQ